MSASQNLLNSLSQDQASTGITTGGSASSRLFQGGQTTQFQGYQPVSFIQPKRTTFASISEPKEEKNFLQKVGGFFQQQVTSFKALIKKPEPISLPSGLDLLIVSPKKTEDKIDSGPTEEKTASAQITEETKKDLRQFYSLQAVKDRRDKIRDEVLSASKEVDPEYKEPRIFGSVVEAIKESTISLGTSIGATVEMIGNMTTSMLLTDIGQNLQKDADKILASNPEWSADPEEKWNTTKISRLVAGALPSLLGVVAASFMAGPAGGASVGFAMEGGSTYKEAIESGASEEDARKYGLLVGSVNSVLEVIFPSKLLDKKKIIGEANEQLSKSIVKDIIKKVKSFGIKFLKAGQLEGKTELLQELWSNIVATSYDEDRKLWDNLLEAYVGGFGAGGITGVTLDQGEYTPQQVFDNVVGSPMQDTEEGKILIKSAAEAQGQGNNIVIAPKEETGDRKSVV